MSENLRCRICNKVPKSYKTALYHKGMTFPCWVVECGSDEEDQEYFPFVDHSISVYGKNQKEAEKRWEEINK